MPVVKSLFETFSFWSVESISLYSFDGVEVTLFDSAWISTFPQTVTNAKI